MILESTRPVFEISGKPLELVERNDKEFFAIINTIKKTEKIFLRSARRSIIIVFIEFTAEALVELIENNSDALFDSRNKVFNTRCSSINHDNRITTANRLICNHLRKESLTNSFSAGKDNAKISVGNLKRVKGFCYFFIPVSVNFRLLDCKVFSLDKRIPCHFTEIDIVRSDRY